MVQARLHVTLPPRVWISQISRQYPESFFQVTAAMPADNSGTGLVTISGPNISAIAANLEIHPQLVDLTIIDMQPTRMTIHFTTKTPLLVTIAREAGVLIEFPVEIANGEATLSVVGSRSHLSEFATQFDRRGFEYTVDHVGNKPYKDTILSERQREVLETAVEKGYYDTPRQCTLTELAASIDVAKSTCSETLHRAEESIIKHYLEEITLEI